ncbi:MAG TPA: hypothetical protein VFZ95_14135 [Steroidobacteraceae bacterium]
MGRIALSVLACWLIAVASHADSWAFKDSVQTWRFADGLRVDVITDAQRDGSANQYVKIVRGSRVLGILNGVGFETLVESPDHRLYVGLSNTGLPGTAAVVFDHDGRVLLYASHWAGSFAYCRASVTIDRTWYDGKNPDVRFDDGKITLNDCSGTRISLFEAVGQALAPRGESG